MTRCFIAELSDGDVVEEVFLICDKQVRTNRNEQLYLQLNLDDRTGSLSARYWNATEQQAREFEPGDFLWIKGKVQLFQGQLQLIINSFRKVDANSLDPADFLPSSQEDIESLEAELRSILTRIENPYLRAIGQAFLLDGEFMDQFRRAPAGIRNHHAYIGGLMVHVVTLLQLTDRISDLYPGLNHDLLQLGIFLHDIGKVRELSYERGFSYSNEGQLVGHLVIGVEMLDEKLLVAGELLGEPIPEDLTLQLKHLIVSHHGDYEFGSPKLPMTPEAIALHHLDNLDAKVSNFSQTIQDDPNRTSEWTPYDPNLRRRLYKGPIGIQTPDGSGIELGAGRRTMQESEKG